MFTTRTKPLTFLALLGVVASAPACRGPVPCPDCGEQAEADDADAPPADLPPLPDLPCGGADIRNDNYNCGSCGNECPLWYEGSEWEAGTCVEGVCGPLWTDCLEQFGDTCGEICALGSDQFCVANGCSGFTALLFDTLVFSPCENPVPDGPAGVMTGSCDEPIPWQSDFENPPRVQCCCAG